MHLYIFVVNSSLPFQQFSFQTSVMAWGQFRLSFSSISNTTTNGYSSFISHVGPCILMFLLSFYLSNLQHFFRHVTAWGHFALWAQQMIHLFFCSFFIFFLCPLVDPTWKQVGFLYSECLAIGFHRWAPLMNEISQLSLLIFIWVFSFSDSVTASLFFIFMNQLGFHRWAQLIDQHF